MDSLENFRNETRKWLEEMCPTSQREPLPADEQVWAGRRKTFPSKDAKIWLDRMADRGWTAPEWPAHLGGGGLTPAENKILEQEMRSLNCRKPLFDLGLMMLGAAILEHGTAEQQAEHIPPMVRGDIRWCQGFSEPGAGSDLVSLRTKAEDKGDHYLVNGSKLWTSFADRCDYIFCLVRTGPEGSKHKGISVLLIDLEWPGVSVEPIRLINDSSEFCQTFLDNVVVPKKYLLGEVNKGWDVVKTVLAHERKLMSADGMMAQPDETLSLVSNAKKYLSINPDSEIDSPVLRDKIAAHEMWARADQLTAQRINKSYAAGQPLQALPLIMKYIATKELQSRDELLLEILGAKGLSWTSEQFSPEERHVPHSWAFNKAVTIGGGTSEIQLNIIAKRILGLPA